MHTAVKPRKIGNMTVDELRSVIRDTVHEFIDPDHGLALRPTIEEELKASRKERKKRCSHSSKHCKKTTWAYLMHKVIILPKALDDLTKLDKTTANRILTTPHS